MKKEDLNKNKRAALENVAKVTMLKTKVQQQDEYVNSMKKTHAKFVPLIATKNFMVSIRDSGYKSTGTAINELIDNAVEAEPNFISIFNTEKNNDIADVYIIDDGHGMSKDMLKYAVSWAGTHRHLSDDFWGKYGFGLPSAAMFMTEEYTVYSKREEDSQWSEINISLSEIQATNYDATNGVVYAPEPTPGHVPKEVLDHLKELNLKLEHGTIIKLHTPKEYNGLSYGFQTKDSFGKSLFRTIGVTYRPHNLRGVEIRVNKNIVEPIDPLFITPGAKYFDQRSNKAKDTEKEVNGKSVELLKASAEGREVLFNQGILAKPFDSIELKMKAPNGRWASIRLRFSLMHPNFGKIWEGKRLSGRASASKSPRAHVMKENNGYLIVARAGRQIDVVDENFESKAGIPTQIYTRNWAVELDFDPALDSYFGITVNKQQITIANEIWNLLESPKNKINIPQFIKQNLMNEVVKMYAAEKARRDAEKLKQEQSKAIEAANKFGNFNPSKVNNTDREKSAVLHNAEANELAKEKGISVEDARQSLLEESSKEGAYTIAYEDGHSGPICRCEFRQPGQVRVIYNTSHPFVKKFYLSKSITSVVRNAIDCYFFAWAESNLNSNETRQLAMNAVMADVSLKCLETLTYVSAEFNMDAREEYEQNI